MKKSPRDPQKYNEYRVEIKHVNNTAVYKDGLPVFGYKKLTDRGTVSISEVDAKHNNDHVEQALRWYEPVEVEETFEGKTFDEWTLKDLHELADGFEIKLEATKKADIIEELKLLLNV